MAALLDLTPDQRSVLMLSMTLTERYVFLGRILLEGAGEDACQAGYGTTDPYWVGRYGLGFGDITQEGDLT